MGLISRPASCVPPPRLDTTRTSTRSSLQRFAYLSQEGQGAIRLTPGAEMVPQQVWVNKDAEPYMSTPVLQGKCVFA